MGLCCKAVPCPGGASHLICDTCPLQGPATPRAMLGGPLVPCAAILSALVVPVLAQQVPRVPSVSHFCHVTTHVFRVYVLPSPVSCVPHGPPSLSPGCHHSCAQCPPCAAIPVVPRVPLSLYTPSTAIPVSPLCCHPCATCPLCAATPPIQLCRQPCPVCCPPCVPCPAIPAPPASFRIPPISPLLPRPSPCPLPCPRVPAPPWRRWPTCTRCPWPTGTGGPGDTAPRPPPSSSSAARPSAAPSRWGPAWPRGCGGSEPSASPLPVRGDTRGTPGGRVGRIGGRGDRPAGTLRDRGTTPRGEDEKGTEKRCGEGSGRRERGVTQRGQRGQ